MKQKKLMIVTAAYPYGQGETFVRTELEHISAYFAEVEVVPCSYTAGIGPRPVTQTVNMEYAHIRWGLLRKFHMVGSFLAALAEYAWWADALHILTHPHKVENFKELARALYRARLFERFLEAQLLDHKKTFDIIYFYWMVPEIMGAIGFRKSSRLPLKIVTRAHGGDLYVDLKSGAYAGLRDAIADGVDEIYCISDHGRSYLEDCYPCMTEKFHAARLGVDDPGYLNVQPEGDPLSIVSCSFILAGKRLHLIVEAIAFLLDRDPALKIKWTHVGDGELFDQLRAEVAAKLEGRAQVVFAGYLTQPQVMDRYRDDRFDVFVNVSDSEGIPVSLMEASSAGIPMIATDVGGSGEIVNESNGILIPANASIETIAASLLRFSDRAFASGCRKNARSYWDQYFNARVNYSMFGKVLLDIAERSANPA
jgi:colanic acid/amylovoran biosynthesis glycosyltransferase